MARRLLSLVTAIATGAAVVVAVSPGPATAAGPAGSSIPTTPFTAYSIDTGRSAVSGFGTRFEATSSASGYAIGGGLFAVQGTDPVVGYGRVFLAPPTGEAWSTRVYDIAAYEDATHARVQIDLGAPAVCGTVSGSLTVHEVSVDGSANVSAFAGSVRGTCGSDGPIFQQEIRWNATVPFIRLLAPVNSATRTETVDVSVGSETTFGDAVVTVGGADVRVVADTCSGATIAAGGTCSLGVTATPYDFGPAQALVTVPDGSQGLRIPVTVVGLETANGAYTPLKPTRLLDTRRKVGISTTTPIKAGKYIDLQVTGRGGVPSSGPVAVVLNVTVVAPTSAGYLTLYPTAAPRPTASSVNFNRGWTGANLITVRLGTGGKVRIWNYAGSTHVVADVMGYYHGATSTATSGYGGYGGVKPLRLLDTRSTSNWDGSPLGRDEYVWVAADFGTLNPDVRAFAVNITVTRPTGTGYLSAWDGRDTAASDFPSTSTLNFTTGRTVPNMAIVPTFPCDTECADPTTPKIGVLNTSSGSAHVIVDLVGFFDGNTVEGTSRFTPLQSPTRIVNTKTGLGLTGAFGPGATRKVTAPAKVAGYNTTALVTNTTGNRPTTNTVITLWAGYLPKSPRPKVSNLNPYAGQVVSNMTITDVGVGHDFWVNNASGTTNLAIDIAGSMELYPAIAVPSATAQPNSSTGSPTGDRAVTAPKIHVEAVPPLVRRPR